jgi:3-(methylthio)propanoyl-CoA dehydrogenase
VIDYQAPVGDLLFALRHAAGAERLPSWDDGLAEAVLTEAGRFIDAVIAPLDPVGDATPARLEEGRVRLPPAFVAAYHRFRRGGWPGLAIAEEYGGQALPHVLAAAVSEMLSGACIAFQMVLSLGQGAMRTLAVNGSAEQRARWMPRLASGEWLATMCLTEPQAGSDLGLVRCLASPTGDGHWTIQGGKIFISGGDQDMTGRQLHLVLARTQGAPSGVKGLALFLCPSELEDGRRNAVTVMRLEEKMGLHASPTCQMAFDGAVAEMVGQPGEGLARMFTMMNAERLDVAVQGVGLAEVAGQRARAYAGERRQGRAGGAETVAIAAHADVRRMLLSQIALTLGTRAMVDRTLVELELGENRPLVEFMTPLCKAFCTDAAVEAAQLAIQVHGGYGYLREYRVEQILRDARITQIYEGTNGIQAMTLAGRLLRLDNGACVRAFADHVRVAAAVADRAGLIPAAVALDRALEAWNLAAEAVARQAETGYTAAAFLRLSGLVAFAAAWARLEAAADRAPLPARIRAAGDFVRRWMLPETAILSAQCRSGFSPPEEDLDTLFG